MTEDAATRTGFARSTRAPTPEGDSRPFGAHLRMSWWKPLLIIPVLPVVMILLQILLYQGVALIDGSDDPLAPTITPLKFLAVNLSIGITGVFAVVLTFRLARVSWQTVLSLPRRFDRKRLLQYLGGAAVLVALGITVARIVAPEDLGWSEFGVSGTTVALLVTVALTTPMQAAGEELMFRGAILPAAASWTRTIRPALALGVAVSSPAFMFVHGSADPWLAAYYVVFGVSTGLMMIISRGLEASIAFHVANNLLTTTLNTIFADGGAFVIDRSAGVAGLSLVVLTAVNIAMVLLVWALERRRRSTAG